MGCGSTKLNSSAHVASSPDNNAAAAEEYKTNSLLTGRRDCQGEKGYTPPCDVPLFPSDSSQGTFISKASSQSIFSTAMGIKGNSTIRVTLSDDGSLLEVETVTVDPQEALCECQEDGGCNLTVAQIDSIPEHSGEMDTYSIAEGQCDSQQHNDIPDNSRKSLLLSNAYNCLCSQNEAAINRRGDRGKTNSACSCINESNRCPTASKLAHSSLPNIKSRCWEDSGSTTPSHSATHRCSVLKKGINHHSDTGLVKRDPGAMSENNCVQTEHNDHSTVTTIPKRGDKIKRSVSDCYYPHLDSAVSLVREVDEKRGPGEVADSFLPSINGRGKRNRSPLAKHIGSDRRSPAMSDYTCLDYCARECYKNPSLPRLSSKQTDNIRGSVSTPRSVTIPSRLNSSGYTRSTSSPSSNSISTSAYSSSIKTSNCSSNNNKYSRSNNSSAISRGSTTKSSAKSTPSSAYKNESSKNCSEKPPLNSKLFSADSTTQEPTSFTPENTFTSRPSSRESSPMSSVSSNANLPKGRSSKKYLSIFKTKALSEDTPSVMHKRGNLKPKHSASFDGPTALTDGAEDDFLEPLELNICDISHVHQDFFNDFDDFYDEEDNM